MSIRVVVADDHEVVRRGIAAMLAVEDIEIVGEASTGAEAVTSTQALQPDIVLMDIRMPEGDGTESARAIREKCPDVKVIMFSGYDNPTYVARSATAGAVDYVLKGLSRGYLLAAIRRAVAEEGPTPDGLMHRIKHIMGSRRDRLERPNFNLTHREYQVLRHIALGLSNREISESLSISVETVKEHVQNILRKVNASDRTQAAVWAVKEKLL
jgi:DNA-binding NarL/FixJ family response regulator